MAANDLQHTNSASTVLSLNDGSTYDLAEPLMGALNLNGEPRMVDVPLELPAAQYLGDLNQVRTIPIRLWVRGSGLSGVTSNLRALWAQFWVDKRDGALGILQWTAWNSNIRAIKGIPAGTTIADWVKTRPSSTGVAQVEIPFQCPDPTFYNPTAVTPSGNFNGATPVNVSCANAGDCDSFPQITYTTDGATALVNPKITDAYGRVWEYTDTIAISSTLVVNFDPFSLAATYTTGGSPANWLGRETAASQLIRCKYGTNNLTFVCTSGTAAISISLVSRYSTHG